MLFVVGKYLVKICIVVVLFVLLGFKNFSIFFCCIIKDIFFSVEFELYILFKFLILIIIIVYFLKKIF